MKGKRTMLREDLTEIHRIKILLWNKYPIQLKIQNYEIQDIYKIFTIYITYDYEILEIKTVNTSINV